MKKLFLLTILLLPLLSCSMITGGKSGNISVESEEDALINKINFSSLDDLIAWTKIMQNHYLQTIGNKYYIFKLGELCHKLDNSDYQSYLNFLISDIYWQNGYKEQALFYMLKVEKTSYILEYLYRPIGYYIAKRIISIDCAFNLKEDMYLLLLDEYNELIDIHYTMAELTGFYQEHLEMDDAIAMMKKILKTANKSSLSAAQLQEMRNEIYFYNLKKLWVHQNLETLIKNIEKAIKRKNSKLLWRYVSKRKFDVELFQKKDQKRWTYSELGIHRRWNNRIVFAKKLEDFSSENEAFLRTDNWTFPQMRTWYFRFNKIFYPYDKDINGSWEWSGIYFGNPF